MLNSHSLGRTRIQWNPVATHELDCSRTSTDRVLLRRAWLSVAGPAGFEDHLSQVQMVFTASHSERHGDDPPISPLEPLCNSRTVRSSACAVSAFYGFVAMDPGDEAKSPVACHSIPGSISDSADHAGPPESPSPAAQSAARAIGTHSLRHRCCRPAGNGHQRTDGGKSGPTVSNSAVAKILGLKGATLSTD
jgi:hypothetical protein